MKPTKPATVELFSPFSEKEQEFQRVKKLLEERGYSVEHRTSASGWSAYINGIPYATGVRDILHILH